MCEDIGSELKDAISKKFPEVVVTGNNYKMVTTSRYISQIFVIFLAEKYTAAETTAKIEITVNTTGRG